MMISIWYFIRVHSCYFSLYTIYQNFTLVSIMKTLFLIRHSKSEWDEPFSKDHERGLAKRGKKNAESLAKLISKRNIKIEKGYISDSQRTLDTLAILEKEGSFIENIQITNLVYEASKETLLSIIQDTNDQIQSIAILGHNPGLEEFANHLLGTSNLFVKFPTSAFLELCLLEDSWRNIENKPFQLRFFWIPEK